ncbi:hypothetical protein Tco_0498912 [Tanacetum coccineum]
MPRFSLNDMVHNHYPEEARKKTQEKGRNSEPSVMPSARSQSIANDSKPKPRINNQRSRNWPASKSSCETTKTVPIAKYSRNSRNFYAFKHFVCLIGAPFNLKKERIKAWIKENVISGRPRLHGIALIQEISARQKS